MALNPNNYTHPFWGLDEFFSSLPTAFFQPRHHESVTTSRHHAWMLPDFFAEDMFGDASSFSPGYEIQEDDTSFQLTMDMPENVVKASDVLVELQDDRRVLHVGGSGHDLVKRKREDGKEEVSLVETSRFDHRLTIGHDVDTTKLKANLNNGVLTVTAPKRKKKELDTAVRIPVIEGPSAASTVKTKEKERIEDKLKKDTF